MVSGAAGGFVGMLGDLAGILSPEEAQELQRRWAALGTYEPKTEAGREQMDVIGGLTESLPPVTGAATPRVRIGKESKRVSLPESERRAVEFAKQTGAPLMESDINPPKTFPGKAVRGVAEKVPLVGTAGQRAKQQEARQGAIKSFTESYDAVTDTDLYNSLVDSQSKVKKQMSKGYDQIGEQMQGEIIPKSNTLTAIDMEIERLNKPGSVKNPEMVAKLETLRDDLLSGDSDYQGMRDNRTLVRETLKSDDSRTTSDRVIDRVYSAMTKDIQDSVTAIAGEDAARKLKALDSQLAKQYKEARNTKLKNILNKGDVKPEEVKKMLLSTDKSEVGKLYSELDNTGRGKARGVLVSELGKVFDENESPEKFLQRARKLENQFDVFFNGEQKDSYKNLISYLNQTRQASNAGVLNQNGQQLMTLITMAPVADIAGTGGVATATAITAGTLGKLMESRKVNSALRRLKKIRPYTPEYNQALIALDNAVNEIKETTNQN
jgi:hypothetical protein